MKMKKFLNKRHCWRHGRYVTDGALICVKKCLNLDLFEKQKIKELTPRKIPLEYIPFEAGEEIKLHPSVLSWDKVKYVQIRGYAAYASRPVFF